MPAQQQQHPGPGPGPRPRPAAAASPAAAARPVAAGAPAPAAGAAAVVPPRVVRPGHVVAVGNLKGGSGKSTLAVNLACAMAAAGRRVAVMDCDPQGSAAQWAARGRAPVKVHAEPLPRLDAAPGWLARADWLRSGRDALVVDLPAVAAPATAAAFLIASVVLVPTAASSVEVEGTRRVLALLEAAARERPGRPPRVLLVPVRVREMEGGLEDWRGRLAALGLPMTAALGHHSEFDASFARGSWVGDGFRGSRAARELGRVAERVLHELELAPAPAPPAAEPDAPPRAPWWRRLFLPPAAAAAAPRFGTA